MGLFWRIIIGIFVSAAGLFCLARTRKVVLMIGYNGFAERHLGSGGTYILVKIIGIIALAGAVLFVLGVINI